MFLQYQLHFDIDSISIYCNIQFNTDIIAQACLKALASETIKSKLVNNAVLALNEAARLLQGDLTLRWLRHILKVIYIEVIKFLSSLVLNLAQLK